MLKKVETTKAPAAIGPYSQGMLVNGMLYASGQIPIVPETGEVVKGDIEVQAKQVMRNVGEILKAAGRYLPAVLYSKLYMLPAVLRCIRR